MKWHGLLCYYTPAYYFGMTPHNSSETRFCDRTRGGSCVSLYLCSERRLGRRLARLGLASPEHLNAINTSIHFKSLQFLIVYHIRKSVVGDQQHIRSKAGASRRPNLHRCHRCRLRRIHQLLSVPSTRDLVPPAATVPTAIFALRRIPLLVVSARCSIPKGPKGKVA